MSEKFSLRWNDYQSNWSRSLSQLRKETDFADVTLVTDDKVKFLAHKILLSSCSNTFKFILKENTHANPLIYLSGVSSVNLGFILDYIYNGEVNLYQEQLDSFLESSQKLEIEGLLGGKQEQEKPESLYSEKDIEIEDLNYKPNEVNSLVKSVSPVKRRQISRATTKNVDDVRFDVSSMTPEKIERKIEDLLQKTDDVWSCLACEFTNVKKFNVRRHIETHIDGLLYSCNFCQKEFRLKDTLNKHVFTNHRN